MLYDWRITRLQRRIKFLEQVHKNVQASLDKPHWDDILLANGSETADADAVLVNLSERRVALSKRIERLRVKRFKKSLPRMFKEI